MENLYKENQKENLKHKQFSNDHSAIERERGGGRGRVQLDIFILMSLKSSRVIPRSLSSGWTTSTSSGSINCLLQSPTPTQIKNLREEPRPRINYKLN